MPCPDCNASWVGTELEHESSCPISAGIDAVCDEDRQYFLDHPQERYRTRGITWAELETLDNLGTLAPDDRPNHVHVLNQPWGRVRQFCDYNHFSSMAIDPDEEVS
jgi:hypothetical protein